MGNGDGPTEPIAPELIVDEKEKNLHQVNFQVSKYSGDLNQGWAKTENFCVNI